MGSLIDMTSKRFGRLVVISRARNGKNGCARWNCLCDCGKQTTVQGYGLRNGDSQSCGCLRKERSTTLNTTHGMKGTPAYESWRNMKKRCLNKNAKGYKYYGGRGITICDRWLEFENFYADMGDRPEGMTIGRVNNNKGYSPENCKWVTTKEQNRNSSRNRIIAYRGKKQCLVDWAEELNLRADTLACRLKHHPPQIAFNM